MNGMKKKYLSPRIKTLKIKTEDILNFASVNNEVGNGVQLGKEVELDDFDGEKNPYDESMWTE